MYSGSNSAKQLNDVLLDSRKFNGGLRSMIFYKHSTQTTDSRSVAAVLFNHEVAGSWQCADGLRSGIAGSLMT